MLYCYASAALQDPPLPTPYGPFGLAAPLLPLSSFSLGMVHASGFVSAIPAGVKVRALFLGAHGDAYVDLGPEILAGHRGGSLGEALAVFAIVNAVTSNLPDVRAVQILVDGKEVDSLAGHIDLREPITRANAWIRKGQ